jgi:hypothetical protein
MVFNIILEVFPARLAAKARALYPKPAAATSPSKTIDHSCPSAVNGAFVFLTPDVPRVDFTAA